MPESELRLVHDLERIGALRVEDGNHGEYRPRPDEFVREGVAFIRAADLESGRVLFERAERINETARGRIRKGVGQPGDVLLSHKGTVGKVALAPLGCEPFVCSPQTTFWRAVEDSVLEGRYLYYFLQSPPFRAQLEARQNESDMAAYVSLTQQRQLAVLVPPIRTQRAIAAVLGALDDKIELNRRMNETLDRLRRVLFARWFFIRDIWPRTVLGEHVDLVPGRSYSSDDLRPSATALVTLKSFRRGGGYRPDGLKPYIGPYKPEQVVEPAEIVVACTDITQAAEVVGRPARVPADPSFDTLVVSLDAVIVRPKAPLTRAFLYSLLELYDFTAHAYAHTSGTTVLHLDKQCIRTYDFRVPPPSLIEAFDGVARPLLGRIDANTADARTLAALRDALLPKLISGEVRVREAEQIVEAAL